MLRLGNWLMKFQVNASGSNGNNTIIQYSNVNVIIDAGVSRKKIVEGLKELDINLDHPTYILITHEHSDHVKGLAVLYDSIDFILIATKETLKGILKLRSQDERFAKVINGAIPIEPKTPLSLSGITITAYRTVHDTKGPVGFTIESDVNVGYVTDTADISKDFQSALSKMDVLVMESNYDPGLLKKSRRPLFLKRRIRETHLSNKMSLELFGKIKSKKTKILITGHLSGECNKPVLVAEGLETMRENSSDFEWVIATRNRPSSLIKCDGTGGFEIQGGVSSRSHHFQMK